MHSITWPHYSTTILYISSSGTLVGTKLTATNVVILNNMAMLWSAYHCVHGTSCFVLCQPVRSCIEPSLHGLDFFLEIFLWRLYNYIAACLQMGVAKWVYITTYNLFGRV